MKDNQAIVGVMPTNEELMIARPTRRLLRSTEGGAK